jgi:MoaA/NifB/PqqE/SkfB family radical SAM enzyme
MKLIKEIQPTPNLSIILPGGCNGKCSFCFWKKTDTHPLYVDRLEQYLTLLPNIFTQCSITGGEPTLSVFLEPVLELIKKKGYPKVVLTTNGTNIMNNIDLFDGVINHINLSRHSINDDENYKIFNCNDVPNSDQLIDICNSLNKINIDLNLNCVVSDNTLGAEYVYDFIDYAKTIGATSVTFRKNYDADDLELISIDELFSDFRTTEKSCPVCKTRCKLICGMPIYFKYSLKEPSDHVDFIYEAIYHPNGLLTEDWHGLNEIKFVQESNININIQKINSAFSSSSNNGHDHYTSCGQSRSRSYTSC